MGYLILIWIIALGIGILGDILAESGCTTGCLLMIISMCLCITATIRTIVYIITQMQKLTM